MRGVRAVQHVISRRTAGFAIGLLNGIADRLSAGQPAVGLDRERDHRGNAGLAAGTRHADSLFGIVDGEGADEIGVGVAEDADLPAVIVLRFGHSHRILYLVAVAARPDVGGNDDRRLLALVRIAQRHHKVHRCAVRDRELGTRIAELRGPVRIGAPRGSLQHETRSISFCDRDVAFVVVADARDASRRFQKIEACEVRQLDAFMKDQRGLEPAIGEKQAARQLRQLIAVL